MIGLYIVLIFWFIGLGLGIRSIVEQIRAQNIKEIEERDKRLLYVWKRWQLPGVVFMGIAMLIFVLEKLFGYVQ